MSRFRPTPAQERWHAVEERYPSLREAVRRQSAAGHWKYATLLTRCLFFVLGLFVAGAAYAIFDIAGLPLPGIVTGLVLIGFAEWLIRRRGLFASGIEESLWAAGSVLFVFDFYDEFLSSEEAAGLLLMAAVLALAGWRLLNPLLTTLAALIASAALALLIGSGWMLEDVEGAGYASFALAFGALGAGGLAFQRPSHDRMLDWLVVAMPAIGYIWLNWSHNGALTLQVLLDGRLGPLVPLLLVSTFGLAALVIGLRRRRHAPLVAVLVCVLLIAYELRNLTGLSLQWRLIFWGGLGLLGSIILERALRLPRNGITSRDVDEDLPALDLMQMGGAAVVAQAAVPTSGAPATAAVEGQGGSFGGGGASGRF